MISNNPFEDNPRLELEPYLGQIIRFQGTVVNVASPTAKLKYSCVRNAKIALIDNNTLLDNALLCKLHHVWVNTSDCTWMKHQINQSVEGVAEVIRYQRKNGTYAYGLSFNHECNCQSGLNRQINDFVYRSRLSPAPHHVKVQQYRDYLQLIEEQLNDGRAVLMDCTAEEFLKEVRQFEAFLTNKHSGVLTLNRTARRAARCKTRNVVRTQAKGFC